MKITGTKSVASASKSLKGFYSPEYLELFYEPITGKCWCVYHNSIGHNSFTRYDDDSIIACGIIYDPVLMAEVKEMIKTKMESR